MADTHEIDHALKQQLLNEARGCADIILFKHYVQVLSNESKKIARTKPNQRLKEVFDIDNVLTSTRCAVAKQVYEANNIEGEGCDETRQRVS